jgi:O-antigen/teichoic acid export membrane protein
MPTENKNMHSQTILTRAIFSNSVAVFLVNILKNLIGFVVSVKLARYLGVSEFGIYSYVFTFITFFDIIPKLGMDAILIREVSHNRKECAYLLGNALALRFFLAFFGMLAIFTVVTCMKGFSRVTFLVYYASFGLLFSLQLLYETMFKVDLKMYLPAFVNLGKTVMYAVLVFILIYLRGNLYIFILASILSGFVSLFMLIQFSRRYFVIPMKFDFTTWKWLIKESAPLLLSGIFTLIYTRIDVIILESFQGFAAVGLYAAAHRYLDALMMIPTALVVSLYPLMSQYFNRDRDRFRKVCAFGLKYMLLTILPFFIGTCFFANKIMFIFGRDFSAAAISLKLLIASSIFSFVNIILVNAVIAARRQIIDTIISGLSVFLNIGLNLVLIPRYSFNGASFTVLVTEIFGFSILIISLLRISGLAISDIKIGRIVVANLFLLSFLFLGRNLNLSVVLIGSLFVYVSVVMTLRIVRRDIGYLLGSYHA